MYIDGSLQGILKCYFSFCSFPWCPLLLHHLADLWRRAIWPWTWCGWSCRGTRSTSRLLSAWSPTRKRPKSQQTGVVRGQLHDNWAGLAILGGNCEGMVDAYDAARKKNCFLLVRPQALVAASYWLHLLKAKRGTILVSYLKPTCLATHLCTRYWTNLVGNSCSKISFIYFVGLQQVKLCISFLVLSIKN